MGTGDGVGLGGTAVAVETDGAVGAIFGLHATSNDSDITSNDNPLRFKTFMRLIIRLATALA